MSSSYSSLNLYLMVQQTIERWRRASQAQIPRIDHDDRTAMAQLQVQQGEQELALARTEHLQPIADRRWSKSHKQLVELGIVILGALTFSAAPSLLASSANRGPLAMGAGMAGGGAVTYLVHDRAARGLSKRRRRHDSQQALVFLEHQHQKYPSQNELVDQFYDSQKIRLLQVEKTNLESQFAADLALAGVGSLVEGVTAFLLVQPAGPLLAAIAALFPVGVVWLAAAWQGDRVNFADACNDLVKAYQAFLPTGEVSEEEVLQVQKLDAAFDFFVASNPSKLCRNVEMAKQRAAISFADKRIYEIETEGLRELEQRQLLHRIAIAELPNRYTMPTMDVAGHPEWETPTQKLEAERAREQWIANQAQQLEAELAADLAMLQQKYGQQIQRWRTFRTQAEVAYRQADDSGQVDAA